MKILAVITAADTAHACLNAALVASAVDRSASIKALHVVVDPDHLVASTEEIQLQRLRQIDEGNSRERERAAQAAFTTWNAGGKPGGPGVTWKAIMGAEEESLLKEAREADLIVLASAQDIESNDARHAALLSSGRLTLIVPGRWRPKATQFDHIAVGLSEIPIADDAVRAALPWLKKASKVTALHIGNKRDPALAGIDRLLEAGIQVKLHVAASDGENLGARIVREASSIGADLLVAGAYRHNRIIEWLLGGTTRHMLAAAELPLMLAH
jgi:nucleotide-binding universal stress UspA family protein